MSFSVEKITTHKARLVLEVEDQPSKFEAALRLAFVTDAELKIMRSYLVDLIGEAPPHEKDEMWNQYNSAFGGGGS